MSRAVVITGVGRDKVGIVAEITDTLLHFGCNLLDSSMTLLRGEFALILMASVPQSTSVDQFRSHISELAEKMEMNIHVRELTDDEMEDPGSGGNPHIISVYGADKPGIVAGITRRLAHARINITDVQTKYTGHGRSSGDRQPVFLMILEVEVPNAISTEEVERHLLETGQELGVDVTVQALEVLEL